MLRVGLKRCEFCGRKVPDDDPAPASRRRVRKPAAAWPPNILKAVGVAGLVIGLFFVVPKYAARRGGPTPPPVVRESDRQQAFKVCEHYIKRHPPATFSVSSIASGLVAQDKDGFAVTGTVELQDPAGAAVRRRYSCRVLPDEKTGMIVEEGRIF